MKNWLRQVSIGLAALSFTVLAASCAPSLSQTSTNTNTPVAAATGNAYQAEVAAGISYFKQQAQEQLPLTEALLAALKTGDLEKSKVAYVNARPPYEQIEVLAGSFEQEDSDIDARPYAFDEGESSEEFKGFHRIEAILYRDGDTKLAIPYAEGLIFSVNSLINKLNDPNNFSATKSFAGMLAVGTEVPAKKISSEEETWSDQSLLIFQNNWKGIYSQFEPFASKVAPATAAEVKAAYEACLATVNPFFKAGQVAAAPYSSLDAKQRGAISKAAYRFRDSIAKAAAELELS